jgi:Acetyltransferase (GNAT) domain
MPLFLQPWWLDAVCGASNWRPLLSFDKNGNIRGAMAIHEKQKYGMNWILQPIFTQFLGVWLNYPPSPTLSHKRISFETEVLSDLAAQFPDAAYINLQCHFDLQNGIPFHWAGFQLSTKYTYFLPKETTIEDTFQQFRDYVRTNIRKAEKTLRIEPSDDNELLFKLQKHSVERSGTRLVHDLEFFKNLDAAAKKHGERHLFFAKDDENNIHAGIYFVCDADTVYFLASGMNEKFKGVASTALIWEGIKLAKATNRGFDFEGSMLQHIEPTFRTYNGELRPYLVLKKAKNKWIQAALSLMGRW